MPLRDEKSRKDKIIPELLLKQDWVADVGV
jgi:hypothetical protein